MDYKERLRLAKEALESGSYDKDTIEYIFPELAESEDERIGKEIVNFINHKKAMGSITPEESKRTGSWIAWVEKQSKNNMGISEATKQKLEDNLNKALEKETPESWNEFLEKQGEQKPAWSEEDETALGDALWCCKQAASIAKDENDMGNVWYAETWLKSLRPQNRWKPSDEQMEALEDAIRYGEEELIGILSLLYNDLKKLMEE